MQEGRSSAYYLVRQLGGAAAGAAVFAFAAKIDAGKWETWEPFKESPRGHNIYDVIPDSKNKPNVLALREISTGKIRFDRSVREALSGKFDNEKVSIGSGQTRTLR